MSTKTHWEQVEEQWPGAAYFTVSDRYLVSFVVGETHGVGIVASMKHIPDDGEIDAWRANPDCAGIIWPAVEKQDHLSFYIKWDGCGHWYSESGYLHVCGVEDMVSLTTAMRLAKAACLQAMPKSDCDESKIAVLRGDG